MTTKILSLMFHRVNDPATQCCPKQFAAFLNYLTQHYPIITPDDPLPDVPLAIMLTFDDAYFDFYDTVFPLLKHHNIKALLAVSVNYILPTTTLSKQTRLSVPYPQGMQSGVYEDKAPFCTWEELNEMAKSPHVIIASHGASHANLENKFANFYEEIELSKKILKKHLTQPIRYFVYPYGKMCRQAHDYVKQHYQYGVRIGSAINIGWDKRRQYIYRIDADPLWKQNRIITDNMIRKLTLKYWSNRLRGK